jgi:hypothetical protein
VDDVTAAEIRKWAVKEISRYDPKEGLDAFLAQAKKLAA